MKKGNVYKLIIFYKLLLGTAETIAGLGIAFFGKQLMYRYTFLITRELSEDPHDLIAHISLAVLPNIFTHNKSLILTLVVLGLAKIAGAAGLIYKKDWGVDLLVGLTAIMLPFQLINLIVHRSLFNLLYVSAGIVIALFLVNFKPREWVTKIRKKLSEI